MDAVLLELTRGSSATTRARERGPRHPERHGGPLARDQRPPQPARGEGRPQGDRREPHVGPAPRRSGRRAQRELGVHPRAPRAHGDVGGGQRARPRPSALRRVPVPVLQPVSRRPRRAAGPAHRHEPEPRGDEGQKASRDRLPGELEERARHRDAPPSSARSAARRSSASSTWSEWLRPIASARRCPARTPAAPPPRAVGPPSHAIPASDLATRDLERRDPERRAIPARDPERRGPERRAPPSGRPPRAASTRRRRRSPPSKPSGRAWPASAEGHRGDGQRDERSQRQEQQHRPSEPRA